MNDLPCGCLPGYWECPEAERLRELYSRAYHLTGDAAEVDDAHTAWRAHYVEQGGDPPEEERR